MVIRLSSLKARQRYRKNHREYYLKLSKKSYHKNKEKNREKINKWNRKYRNELRQIARELGYCPSCLKPKENPKYKECIKCREYHREYEKKKKRIKAKECPCCKIKLSKLDKGVYTCTKCGMDFYFRNNINKL